MISPRYPKISHDIPNKNPPFSLPPWVPRGLSAQLADAVGRGDRDLGALLENCLDLSSNGGGFNGKTIGKP